MFGTFWISCRFASYADQMMTLEEFYKVHTHVRKSSYSHADVTTIFHNVLTSSDTIDSTQFATVCPCVRLCACLPSFVPFSLLVVVVPVGCMSRSIWRFVFTAVLFCAACGVLRARMTAHVYKGHATRVGTCQIW